MINSTSFAPMQGAQLGQMSSIMPMNQSSVVIDGKEYPVITVQDKKPGVFSYAPMYKQVVIIDGKQYDVQTVQDPLACDKTKNVVIIDGEQHDVQNKSMNDFGGILGNIGTFKFDPSARTNKDSTISYMA